MMQHCFVVTLTVTAKLFSYLGDHAVQLIQNMCLILHPTINLILLCLLSVQLLLCHQSVL